MVVFVAGSALVGVVLVAEPWNNWVAVLAGTCFWQADIVGKMERGGK